MNGAGRPIIQFSFESPWAVIEALEITDKEFYRLGN